jgi:hypothetical protein
MTATHVHLVLNHVPILGVLFAGALFLIAAALRSTQFQRVALAVAVVAALSAVPVYLTGEPAEDAVEHAAGVSETVIDRHADAAEAALIAVAVLGAISLLGIVGWWRAAALPAPLVASVLLVAAVTGGLFAWTGYLGGQIRHPEIHGGGVQAAATDADRHERGREDDDD